MNMSPSPTTPKLDARFIIKNDAPRRLDVLPRIKEVERDVEALEEWESNDGFRQKVRWDLRDCPELDEEVLVQLTLQMEAAAEDAEKDWKRHDDAIKEAVKMERDARNRAKAAAFARHRAARAANASVFIKQKRR
ncbi:hypothetical protein F4808DRAFT_440354 [Astrocystis sublimbata]|nr:hypothetical protein F4808DRAFT_440354 [Astrocystis sublimbata]